MDAGCIYVRVIGKAISEKELEIYFQSRKQSGGGDISSVEPIKDREFIITFEDQEVARNVTLGAHTISGSQVEASLHPFIGENPDLPSNQSSSVIVRGFVKNTTEDALLNYFENTKRSGGGPVEEVKITGNSARVKFESSEVATNVTLRAHTINGSQVEVSLHPFLGENPDLPSNQSSSVIVRGFSKNTTEDALLNYFENTKRSGGGPVEEVKITGNSARVKFESSEVANCVVQREKHLLNDATLDVSAEMSDDRKEVAKTIIVTGLATITTKDSLLNYFENKRRSGGGYVDSVNIQRDNGVAFVTFEDANVVSDVLQREQHSLDGAVLIVISSSNAAAAGITDHKEIDLEPRTIEVTGLASTTTKDAVINFFENTRRSGGGDIYNVQYNREKGCAVVTFLLPESAQGVLKKGVLTLDNAQLNITLKNPAKRKGLRGRSEEIEEPRTIEVTGLASATTKDAVINFFENSRRSGGGDIDNVEYNREKGCAVVTFLLPESAQGVLKKEVLTLDNAELNITLKEPVNRVDFDAKRLLVRGLSKETTRDALVSFMEIVSGLEVADVEFGEQGCALILLAGTYHDFEIIKQKAGIRKLDDQVLSIAQVPVCNCVRVMGINRENTTKDAIFYYFDNPKNGGGDVKSVDLNINEGWALVFFDEPQVVNKVMEKSHTLNGARLEVRLHNPVLAKPSCVPEGRVVEREIPVEDQVMQFIRARHEDDLKHIQNKYGVKVTWEHRSKAITLAPVDEKLMDKDRFEDSSKAIASFVEAFQTYTMHVTPDAWEALLEKFKKTVCSMKDNVNIQYLNQDHKIVLTGKRHHVEGLIETMKQLKTDIDSQLAVEASKTSTTVSDIPKRRLKFLSVLDFNKELEMQYENTKVDIIVDKGQVCIRGPSEIVHRAAADVWQAVANIKEVSCEVPQNAMEVLKRRPCQLFVQQQFTANNLQALATFDAEDEDDLLGTLMVIGVNSDVALRASRLVKTIIVEESVVLDDGQIQLEKSDKWRSFREEITAHSILSVKFDHKSNRLCLAGTREDVSSALRSIRSFLNENTIVSEVVHLPRGCRRFLEKHRERELRSIQDELSKYSTAIKGIADDEDVVVTGTTDEVDKGVKMIYDLALKVESQKVPVNKPGMRKVLNRNNGRKMLALLENDNKCIIEYFDEKKDASSQDITEEEKGDKRTQKESECSFRTPQGKIIKVFNDNICDRNVDVIVNAANSKLQHISGVSKAILDAGGEAIQHECDEFIVHQGSVLDGQVVVTSAGKMPFKRVVHAVGPSWRKEATREIAMGKTPREEKILRYAVSNALDAARDCNSIVLPAISTGAFEFPNDLCAKIMVDATVQFCEENSGCLSEIQFTSTDEKVVKAFVTEMASKFGQDPNFLRGSSKEKVTSEETVSKKAKGRKKTARTPSHASGATDGPNEITTPEGVKVALVVGHMTDEQVDAIVNSTSSDLDLGRNPSAKALSVAAGPSLQQECKAIGSVQTGDIVVTNGGNLKCKHVFHSSCSGWENGKGEQVLRDILKKSLHEAHKRSLVSVAIPAIGTGNLQFPHNRVAAASFEEVLIFSNKNPISTVKEVHLVVYDKDLPTVQAFQTELKGCKRNQSLLATTSGKTKRRKAPGGAAKMAYPYSTPDYVGALDDSVELLDPLTPEISLGSVTVQAEIGDITKETTDAIATLSNTNLNIALNGGVGKAIIDAGGPSIQTECSILGVQAPGTIAVTGAGKLQTKKIYHMIPERLNMAAIKKCITECLKAADSDGLTSISLPAVGTGNVHVGVKEAAQGMLAAIAKFSQEYPTSSLQLIRIMIFQKHMFEDFRGAMEACVSSSGGWTGIFSKLFGWFRSDKDSSPNPSYPTTSKKSAREVAEAYLEVFAGTKEDIKNVIEEVHKYLADQFTTEVIEKDAISKLSDEQKMKIINLQEKHDVTINIEKPVGRISVRGDAKDVLDVVIAIHEILNQKIEEEYCKDVAGLVCKTVQWYYYDHSDDDDGWEPYDPATNYQIETAHGDGQNSVIFFVEDARCEIVFRFMEETCLEDGEKRNVVRKEIGKGVPLPNDWCVHPRESSGKEKEVHLVQLDPTTNLREYNRVADEIRKTASITITKIERVQNPGLYRAYMVKKDQMEEKNGANEKFLFHGTAQGSCSSINKFGFNRSYCGKNATVFGNGVYFARDASYSTQQKYSPPDPNGNRYMYLAHVLVGEYAAGRSGMITPPAKPGSDATDAYDSVVDNTRNPSIFVVFYDNQCYPDYLVTFK